MYLPNLPRAGFSANADPDMENDEKGIKLLKKGRCRLRYRRQYLLSILRRSLIHNAKVFREIDDDGSYGN